MGTVILVVNLFLTSASDEGDESASSHGRFLLEEKAPVPILE
jgi:hypothetical protein